MTVMAGCWAWIDGIGLVVVVCGVGIRSVVIGIGFGVWDKVVCF